MENKDERGEFEWGYGFFPGGDPRDFEPDYEMNSKEEIEAWKADCELAEKGIDVNCPPPGWSAYDKDGNEVLHVLAPRYGMGTYKFRFTD